MFKTTLLLLDFLLPLHMQYALYQYFIYNYNQFEKENGKNDILKENIRE